MLIKGNDLNPRQREMVLKAYVYRWTHENTLVDSLYRPGTAPRISKVSDSQWLAAHSFHFIKDGSRLSHRYSHAESNYMEDAV